MKGLLTNKTVIVLCCLFLFSKGVSAQQDQQQLTDTILKKDSLFWVTYNTCDTTQYDKFFTKDLEFYHDKGGVTLGLENFMQTAKKNLCSRVDFRLRREPVKGTIQVFPLAKDNKIYGAILSGEHLFYIRETGKAERLDGRAKFTHVWLLKEGSWKMSSILSYDHGPASR